MKYGIYFKLLSSNVSFCIDNFLFFPYSLQIFLTMAISA